MKLEGRAMIFQFTCCTPNVCSMSYRTTSCAFAKRFSFLLASCYTEKLNMGAFGYILSINQYDLYRLRPALRNYHGGGKSLRDIIQKL